MDATTATAFLKTFGFKGEYNGKTCTRKLSGGRIARISLSERNGRTCPTQDCYTSLEVEIVGTKTGPIDKTLFVFDEHLTERKDTRTDYPLRGNRAFMVLAYCGWGWYIAVPKSVKPLVDAVEKYIGMFK